MSHASRKSHNQSIPNPLWDKAMSRRVYNRGEAEAVANNSAHNRKLAQAQRQAEKALNK